VKYLVLSVSAAAILFGTVPARAHHSMAAEYFEDKTLSIEGDLAEFLIRNPHSYINLTVKDAKGRVERWSIEWGAGFQLNRQGVTRETLKPGDHLVISGNPGRMPEEHRLRMRTIVRPKDGWRWNGAFE
jgi:hypothetical protein